ncbi:LamG domain-containing protein [Amycolatopsis mediterranei]|uniref:LamG domain-containing protein n=1 Tax=Amycolatopsis mediterranei TaxID=33910 RepID=UPI0002EC1FAD|nr:LamG domain-containing protein [Amycolatopsis mediterranei]UZF70784.1 LamG domain-containing protein [Amycolatopsis mediterranei]
MSEFEVEPNGRRRGGPRRVPVLLAVALAAGVALSVPWGPAAGPVSRLAEAPGTAAAMNAAHRQGTRVEAADQRTGTRTVFANPDGTMTAELSAGPVRVRRGDHWVDIDTALVRTSDGAVRPRAAEGDLVLSGGGSVAPLAELARDGKRLAVRWPGALPAPEIAGDTATYREVLPGVDLVMAAERDGYRERLVVKNAAAAKNPALAAVPFRLETTGVRVSTDARGVLHATDDHGKDVFTAPPAAMWDARGEDHATAVGVDVSAQTLTLRPDLKFLADPATVFPVSVDPDLHTFEWATWNTVLSGKPGTAYPRTSGDGTWAQVGACYTPSGTCNKIGTARAYFQYDTGFLAGKRILGATMNSTVVHSPNCSDQTHQLFMAFGTIDDGTTWDNAPQGWLVSTATAPGVWDACPGYRGIGFPATGGVNTLGISTYFFKAADETEQLAWRKYSQWDTKLSVTYNTRPNAPNVVATDPPLPAPCRWCGGKPYVGDDSIRLQAQLTDPDDDAVKPLWHIKTDGAVEDRWGGLQGSGAYHSTDVDLKSRNGKTVGWSVEAWDTNYAGENLDAGDPGQGPGPFVVDTDGITVPPTVSGVLYPADNRWHGGAGVPGTFTFGANTVKDVDHYLYGWNDPPSTQVDADALGGGATVSVAPDGDGPRDLYVQSVDRAGHRSPSTAFHIYVRPGNGPLAQWSFEGNTKDDANLGWRDGTPVGGPGYTPGAIGSALQLDGTQQVTAPSAVDERGSFSVAAWAKIDRTDSGTHAVLRQNGTATCSFCLQYEGGNGGRWVFVMPQTDSASPPSYNFVRSTAPAVAGAWTHLAASYDAAGHKVRLYVNGVLDGTGDAPSSWRGSDLLHIGYGFPGAIDEVRAYDRRVSDAEVAAMVSGDNVQLGQWHLDEKADVTAANAVPGGQPAKLANGAAFAAGGAIGGAAAFDGQDDYAATAGPVVTTDQSFTVATWVNADISNPVANGFYSALSQDGNVNSGFLLGYRPDGSGGGKWEIYLPSADAVTRPVDEGVRSDVPAVQKKWTHLAAVYDAPAKQIRLYVDGRLAGTAARQAGFAAGGPLIFGRGKLNGSLGHYWPGMLDDVRAYGRVLAGGEIQAMVARDDVAQLAWKFDGDGTDDGAVLPAGPTWTAGQANSPDQADLAIRLDGTRDYVRRAKPVTDTSQSFSVSTWVKLDSPPDDWAAAVSQNGGHTAAFNLGYTGKADNHWAFAMHGPDSDDPAAVRLRSTEAAQLGVWTHLAAVFDRPSGTMSLYVNGLLSATAPYTGQAWNATGEFDVGRAKWGSAWINYWPGAVDDVKLYGRALFASEIRTQSGRDLSLVHDWRFDESSGSTAFDAVGARGASYTGGVSLVPGRVGNAVHVDGTGALTTPAVDLRTDQSFTVSAWVKLDKRDCDSGAGSECKRVALSVDGSVTSKFRLGYVIDRGDNVNGVWTFEMPEADDDTATVTKAAVSTISADEGHWVHLLGVYDQQAKQIWLYVNGTRVGQGTVNKQWNAVGGAAIGRGKAHGVTGTQNWIGDLDDVRMYAGALDKDRISALFASYPPVSNVPAALPAPDAGYWKFDDNAATTAADASGQGHPATLKGGATWIGGRNGPSSWLNGTTAYAETAAPAIDTTKSFSVAAWVAMSQEKNGDRAIVAQDGNRASAFVVQYNAAAGRWAVQVPAADQDNAPVTTMLSTASANANQWVHLALTYDAGLHQLRLYRNGVLQAAQVGVVVPASSGPMSFGRAKWNGANTQFFPGAVDDVRVFARALTGGEVGKIHDDVYTVAGGRWTFDDGTGKDTSAWGNDVTLGGGAQFAPGVTATGLKLDGKDGAAVGRQAATDLTDSFTVSAWAKLARTDRVATVLGQDGDRMSGYVLQYRPELKRWIFGAAQSDTDAAPLAYAYSAQEAAPDVWTHLTGVYDLGRRELRIYVDGRLAGAKPDVTLWRAIGALTIGRAKENGKPSGFFTGTIDDPTSFYGAETDADVLQRASYPAPQAGQLGRYTALDGDQATASTSGAAPAGYHFEGPLGLPATGTDNTRSLYACKQGTDAFTSTAADCEGKSVVGELGKVYTRQPSNLPTSPVYRCNGGGNRFDSNDPACEGAGTSEGLLGYTLAYGRLARLYSDVARDHLTTDRGAPPGFRTEGAQGVVPLVDQPGTQPLVSCYAGADQFLSTDSACEGKTVERGIGRIFTAPPADGGSPLYRCKAGGEYFEDLSAGCAGFTVDRLLGYVLTGPPGTAPVFPPSA